MIFVELIVNVPIRRTFVQSLVEPPPIDPFSDFAPDLSSSAPSIEPLHDNSKNPYAALQTFHYHLPSTLETIVKPGHLVWAPFGAREVQGIVAQIVEIAPTVTKPVARLARPEPVLNSAQLRLAAWIAEYYNASLSEAVKLFLPPGLFTKEDGKTKARTKHELQIRLLADAGEIERRLPSLGRDHPQASVLTWLLANPEAAPTITALQSACSLKTTAPIETLQKQGALEASANGVKLALSNEATQRLLLELRGASKFVPILETLLAAAEPLWKSELYARTQADLAMLRTLEGVGLVELTDKVRFRDPLAGRAYPQTKPPPLTSEQTTVWQTILRQGIAWLEQEQKRLVESVNGADKPSPKFLLHGVTGSGKTEIYLRSIEQVLALGRQVIVLVPEIALTPQTVARFAGRFPGRVTVIHSGLSAGERYDVWRALRDDAFDVVIGPRSALFAPLARLGLIVIDEEHEHSYKQNAEEWGSFTVFYDARVVAQRLADLTGSLLLMGSATPSLERYLAATQGKFTLLDLPRRVMGHGKPSEGSDTAPAIYAELPPVEIVDMRQELRAGHRSMFSRSLQAELLATLDGGEQAIFFLNRRGAHTFVMCRDCGAVQECPRCDVPLTYHEDVTELVCHHCNRRYPIPTICPECKSKRIKYFGSGTERVEEVLKQIAPHARLLRWDADTAAVKGSHEEILRRFSAHEADVLIGTQMIAKGLDFPLVTLVGVVAADVGLYLPDFRSGERTFQLLTQVAGRAGRSERSGRVVIQTYRPEHYAIQAAARHDYSAFYQRELGFRQEHGYPPIRRLARLIYWDKKLEKAQAASNTMATILRQRLQEMGLEGEAAAILGPSPAFFTRFRGYYRWQVLVRAPDPARLLRGLAIPFGWRVDIDPVSML